MTSYGLNEIKAIYEEIGRINVTFSRMEMQITFLIWLLSGDNPEIGQILTSKLNFSLLLEKLDALVHLKIPDKNLVETFHELRKEVETWRTERNRIMHSYWDLNIAEGTMFMMNTKLKRRNKVMRIEEERLSRSPIELFAIRHEMDRTSKKLESFFEKVFKSLKET